MTNWQLLKLNVKNESLMMSWLNDTWWNVFVIINKIKISDAKWAHVTSKRIFFNRLIHLLIILINNIFFRLFWYKRFNLLYSVTTSLFTFSPAHRHIFSSIVRVTCGNVMPWVLWVIKANAFCNGNWHLKTCVLFISKFIVIFWTFILPLVGKVISTLSSSITLCSNSLPTNLCFNTLIVTSRYHITSVVIRNSFGFPKRFGKWTYTKQKPKPKQKPKQKLLT